MGLINNNDNTHRSLEDSKALCWTDHACKAISCPVGQTVSCTLRAAVSVFAYATEDCYMKGMGCAPRHVNLVPSWYSDAARGRQILIVCRGFAHIT